MKICNLIFSLALCCLVAGCPNEQAGPAADDGAAPQPDSSAATTETPPPPPPDKETGEDAATPKEAEAAKQKLAAAGRLMEEQNYGPAAEAWGEFLETYPDHPKTTAARYGLGMSLYRQKQFTAALPHFEQVIAAPRFKQRGAALAAAGHCRLETGDHEGAAEAYRRLLAVAGWEGTAELNLAGILLALDQYAACREMCGDFIAQYPDSGHIHTARYRLARSLAATGDTERAADEAEKIIEAGGDPYVDDALLLLAWCRHTLGESREAVGILQTAVEEADDEETRDRARFYLASMLHVTGKPNRSAAEYRTLMAAKGASKFPALGYRLGAALRAAGQLDEAAATFEEAATRGGDTKWTGLSWYRLARCRIDQGRYDEARELLAELKEDPPPGVRGLAYDEAVCLMGQKQYDRAAEILASYLENNPQAPNRGEALYRRAYCLNKTGAYDRSTALCAALAESDDAALATAAKILAADGLFMQGKYKEADAAFAELGETAKQADPAVTMRRGQCAYFMKQYPRAVNLLSALADTADVAEHPNLTEALLTLGDALAHTGTWGRAAEAYRRYIENGGARLDEARYKFAEAAGAAGERKKSMDVLRELAAPRNDAPWRRRALLALAYEYHADGDYAAAAEALDALAALDPPDAMRARAAFLQGRVLLGLDKPKEALDTFESFAARWPKHEVAGSVRYYTARCLYRSGDRDAAAADAREYIAEHPDGELAGRARHIVIRCLAETDRKKEAKRLFDRMAERKNAAPDELYELAWAGRKCDMNAEARAAYRAMIKAHPGHDLAFRARAELADLLYKAEEFKEAAALSAAVAENRAAPADLRASSRYRAAWCRLKLDDRTGAAKAFTAFARDYPTDENAPAALYQAAAALTKAGEEKKAAGVLEKLLKRYPASPLAKNGLLRRGALCNDLKKPEEALKHFTAFLKKYPADPLSYVARYGCGRAMEATGRKDEAMKMYAAVIEKRKGPVAAECQYRIGTILAARGDYEEAVKELVSTYSVYDYPEWSAKALLACGRACEAMEKRAKAVKAYKTCVKKYPKTPAAAAAAKSLKALGEWPILD